MPSRRHGPMIRPMFSLLVRDLRWFDCFRPDRLHVLNTLVNGTILFDPLTPSTSSPKFLKLPALE